MFTTFAKQIQFNVVRVSLAAALLLVLAAAPANRVTPAACTPAPGQTSCAG